ncbi:MAG TPA: hypothetical protein VK459_12360, partial [Polyangiaceae bacterium]|nr:hypothetical protein [Polyangiaceae bacterium]
GSLYELRCDCDHEIGIESIGRVLRWFVFGVFFIVVFLAAWDEDEFMPWISGILGVLMFGCFGYEVLKRIRAPEIT